MNPPIPAAVAAAGGQGMGPGVPPAEGGMPGGGGGGQPMPGAGCIPAGGGCHRGGCKPCPPLPSKGGIDIADGAEQVLTTLLATTVIHFAHEATNDDRLLNSLFFHY